MNGATRIGPTGSEMTQAAVAQSVERVLGKDEVKGPIPFSSSWLGDRKLRSIVGGEE